MSPLLQLSLLLFLLPAAVFGASMPPGPAQPIDRVLVIVNDDVITQSELDERVPVIKKQLSAQGIRIPSDEVLTRQILERMILERIQLQIAAQGGITVSEERIGQALQGVAQQNKMSPEQFLAALRREGIEESRFREQMRAQLTIQQLLEREINNRVTVSESEIETFLANRKNQPGGTEYNLSHILISVPEASSPETIAAARRRVQDVLQKLKQGADFEQTAIASSQDAKALEGGNLGWKSAGQLPALFVETLENMREGEVSGVIQSANGFHILRLNGRRGGGEERRTITQTRARHILIKPNEIVSAREAQDKALKLRERIEHGVDFSDLARAHSEDTGSAASGGDLGWVNPGQTVPEFERAMNALKPNELSAPVRTPFGYHLIQVLERREQDVSEEVTQNNARSQIHARKADERYEQWLRQLRDEAFVEYRAAPAP